MMFVEDHLPGCKHCKSRVVSHMICSDDHEYDKNMGIIHT